MKKAYTDGQLANRARRPRTSNPHPKNGSKWSDWDAGWSDAAAGVNVAPTPAQVRDARLAAGLTQKQAAALVHWGDERRWGERERGDSVMPPAEWELFQLKVAARAVAARHGFAAVDE
jgi:DNA (cytosine-5)-methyltransferase 1